MTRRALALRRLAVLRLAVLLLLLSSLPCAVARAQTGTGATPSAAQLAFQRPGRLARAAAIAGLVTAGVLFAGTIAIETVDRPETEGITRGIHLGLTALSTPLVALAAYSARGGLGMDAVRALGWAFYGSALALGVAQWYDALHDNPVPTGYGYMYGSLAVLALLPHCFDAYIAGRGERVPSLLVMPNGVFGRF